MFIIGQLPSFYVNCAHLQWQLSSHFITNIPGRDLKSGWARVAEWKVKELSEYNLVVGQG